MFLVELLAFLLGLSDVIFGWLGRKSVITLVAE